MKHVLTIQNKDGTFDEVGMNNRSIYKGSWLGALSQASRIADGRMVRVEAFDERNFYTNGPASRTYYVSGPIKHKEGQPK